MKKAVNLRGYATPAAQARRQRREMSAEGLIQAMKALGMSDEEIIAALKEAQAKKEVENPAPCPS